MSNKIRIRRAARSTGIIATVALATVVSGAQPAAAAPQGKNFGPLIDGYQPSQPQSTCYSFEQPGVQDFRALLLAAYPSTGDSGIWRGCNVGDPSEHKEGRAFDWHVSAFTQKHIAEDALNWLLATDKYGNKHALARRFGIMYIIWDHRMWRAYNPDAGWQPYNGDNPHTDHVHFSFGWPGAHRQTSWWTGGSFGKSTVGYYQASNRTWNLRNTHTNGAPDASFVFGASGAKPITGDWNADGKTTVGYYTPSTGTFNLRNSNNAGAAEHSFVFGPPNMIPLAGDWNNDGKTTVGYYNPGTGFFHLRDSLSSGASDYVFKFGPPNMVPVAGDWNNDGKTTVGYYNPSNAGWYLRDTNDAGAANHTFGFGPVGMRPIVGDWNADGKTTVGYYNPGNATYYLRNSLNNGPADESLTFGPTSMTPVAGDWNKA